MPIKVVKPKSNHYGNIQRGCSFMLPVIIKSDQDKPIDITGRTVVFTVKKVQSDFDRYDDFAYIQKDIEPQDAVNGSFTISLTSTDTDFEPGQYYFDIELYKADDGSVARLCTLTFDLVGGPSNRHVNPGTGQLMSGDTVTVITTSGAPLVVIAPTVAITNPETADEEVDTQALAKSVATLQESARQFETDIESLQESAEKLDEVLNLTECTPEELGQKIKQLFDELLGGEP